MKALWSPSIRGLTPYAPGEQPSSTAGRLIKLNTNENPFPPSPLALSAISDATNEQLRLYPDPEGRALKQTIANMHGLNQDNVFLGNGSDEVLAHAFLAFFKQVRPLLFADVTYSFYPVYCDLYGIDYTCVPLDDVFQVNAADYAQPNGGIVLANPNAPTGISIDHALVRQVLTDNPQSVVLVDEAYVDFGGDSVVPLIAKFPNLLVVHTLSKSRSLAGLRVGFALGHTSLIEALNLVKGCFNSYPLDRLALAGAQAALNDSAHFESTRLQVIKDRQWLTEQLRALQFEVLPSSANFVFVRHAERAATALLADLRERHILVRHFAKPRIDNFLRISIGARRECEQLVRALQAILDATR